MLTPEEYYRQKRLLEIEQRQLDREHLQKQFELNDRLGALEREWDKQNESRES